MTFGYSVHNAAIKSKLQHPPPPGQGPDIGTSEDWIVQIPSPSGQNGVQMLDPIVGFVCKQQSSSSIQDGKLFKTLATRNMVSGKTLGILRNRMAGTIRTAE